MLLDFTEQLSKLFVCRLELLNSRFMIDPKLIEALRNASHTAVITGAGVSAESGVPTFRDAQTGLWAKYEPTELATPQAFRRDPKLVWDWYAWRRERVLAVKPNPGHFALAELARQCEQFTLITQNVDGLHQQAGSENVIELHGNIMRARCFDMHHVAESWPDDIDDQPPKCTQCNSLMRPDVVWFNEGLPTDALDGAMNASQNCDVFFSIGTSSVVQPAASMATIAAQNGATVIEINPTPTPLTHQADFVITEPSGEVLPEIVRELG